MGTPYTLIGDGSRPEKKSDLGAPIIRTDSNRKVFTYRDQKFWAQGGRVYVVDEVSGDFKSCSWKVFVGRLRAMNDGLKHLPWNDEREETQRAVEDGLLVAFEAKKQGDPHDSAVFAEKARARKFRLMTGGIGAAYPDVFPNYKGLGPPRTSVANPKAGK